MWQRSSVRKSAIAGPVRPTRQELRVLTVTMRSQSCHQERRSQRERGRRCCLACAKSPNMQQLQKWGVEGDLIILRRGSNDSAFPEDETQIGNVPVCADPVGLRWMMDIMARNPKHTNTARDLSTCCAGYAAQQY
jgi:hypothetical protein